MSDFLTPTALSRLDSGIALPGYDRQALATGIVHIGLGNFSRAHLAAFTEPLLTTDPRWGIVGVSLQRALTRDSLAPQGHLYSLVIRDATSENIQIIGALRDILVARENPQAVVECLCQTSVHVVTLTITEKGYCHHPANGRLNRSHPDIVHDLACPDRPCSVFGFLAAALAQRRQAGQAPFTIVSCDNLPANGDTLRALLLEFAELANPRLAPWLAAELACPNTVVDRIVPASTPQDRQLITQRLGVEDRWPVITEPFAQWVIEDHFCSARPAWERSGAQWVKDAKPFETLKLRLLNASHSALAYLGNQIGLETVADCLHDPQVERYLSALWKQNIVATLAGQLPEDFDLPAYQSALLRRFENPTLRHRLLQIAMDGSQKLPQRLLDTVRLHLAAGTSFEYLALAIAAWIRHLSGQDENGRTYELADPLASNLQTLLAGANTPAEQVDKILAVQSIFADMGQSSAFQDRIRYWYLNLCQNGVRQCLDELTTQETP